MTKMDSELIGLRREVVRMGSLVNDIAIEAAETVSRLDASLARQVIKQDEPIDEARFMLDDKLHQSLAINHPMGDDLRGIAAAMRICCDLERIGDYAVNVAKCVLKLLDQPRIWLHPGIQDMADICIDMLSGATATYIDRDPDEAREICKQDDEIDALYKEIEGGLAASGEYTAAVVIQNMMIARAFERMGDHITNICEWTMFELTGVHEEMN